MQHLTKLFKLIELTRSQPQYGYALAEMSATKIRRNIKKMKDKIAKAELEKFVSAWSKEMKENGRKEFFEESKN